MSDDPNNNNSDNQPAAATGDDQPVTMGALKAMFGELLAAQRAPAPTAPAPKPTAPIQAPRPAPAPGGSSMEQYAQLLLMREMRAMQEADAARAAVAAREAAAAISPSARLADATAAILADESKPERQRLDTARVVANKMLAGIKIVPDAGGKRTHTQSYNAVPVPTRKP